MRVSPHRTEIRVHCCNYEKSSDPSKIRGDYVDELHLGLCLETGLRASLNDSSTGSPPEGFEDVQLRLVSQQVLKSGQREVIYDAPILQADHMYILYTKQVSHKGSSRCGAGVAKGGPFRNHDSIAFSTQSWHELSKAEQAEQRQKHNFLV